MLTVERIESHEDLLNLKRQWNPLLDRSQTDTIFLTFEWITIWWEQFKDGKQLYVLTVKDKEKLIGIAPLMISKKKIGMKKIEFIGSPLSDYSDFIISERKQEVLKRIYNYLNEHKKEWDFIKLSNIPQTSSTLNLESQDPKLRVSKTMSCVCPAYILDNEWESFKKDMNNRHIRKPINYLSKRGNLEFSKHNDKEDEIMKHLEIYFEQHRKRWNSTDTKSMFNDEDNKEFFRKITKAFLPQGKVSILTLDYNKQPLACDIALRHKQTCMLYSCSYDPDYSQRSPGKILHKFLLEDCINNNYKEVDLLRGNEGYKLKFTNTIKKNFTINIHRSLTLDILNRISDRIENQIRSSERLTRFFKKYEEKLRFF